MTIRKTLDDAAGKICETILPIKSSYYTGRGKELAICTLGSIHLLEEISNSILMDKVAIAGRLLSENRGIDAIISFILANPSIRRIILCGQDVKGHRSGQALLSLYKNGVDRTGRIVGALGPYPIIRSLSRDVEAFRKQIEIVDMTGTTAIEKIMASVP
jgi:tetrahydromethanopterin S-methyltransferase subunit A